MGFSSWLLYKQRTLHSAQKRKLRSYRAPLCTDHIIRGWKRACDEVYHARTIQRCFMRALRRNTKGNIDESLVPQSIRDRYDGTDDEQDTDSEHNSDCEWIYAVPESLYENVLKKEFDHKKCNNIIF